MSISILNIMKDSLPVFTNATHLTSLVNAYFTYIEGEYHIEQKLVKEQVYTDQKIWDREPEPATFTGLACHLGFNSRQQFDDYELEGKFADVLNRARLRIEAVYEKKLHHQSPAGAIFALKSMGWNEKPEGKTAINNIPASLQIEILETGPKPVANEKEVIMNLV